MAIAALGLTAAAANCTAEAQVRIVEAEVGFDGRMKVGCWTPVRVMIDGPAGQTIEPRLIAPDPDGSAVTWPLPAVTLDGQGPRESRGLFRMGRIKGTVRIEAGPASRVLEPLRETDGALQCDRQSTVYVGLLGPAAGFEQAFESEAEGATISADNPHDVRLLEFASPEQLPRTADALEALDVLVVSRSAALDAPQGGVVSQWVAGGGHLVLMLESEDDQGVANIPPPLRWLPIETRGKRTFTDLAGLTDRVQSDDRLAAAQGVVGVRIRIASGRTLVSSLEGPLVVRIAHGLGRVTVFVLDWTKPPLRYWKGLPALCRLLADLAAVRTEGEPLLPSNQLRPTGVSDLTTQLAAQLDQFAEVERPSYWLVLGFVLLFLLVAGPLDYLLVHYWLKRPQVTWFTFPLWVAIASVCGTLYANSHNASLLQCNQFDLIDIEATTGLTRVRSWMTLYSPEPRRYRVEAALADWLARSAGAGSAPPRLTWTGTPETGFRGMYRAEGLDLANPPYDLLPPPGGVSNLPIDQWSSKPLAAFWQQESDASIAALLQNDLQVEGDHSLAGTVIHHLPAPITDWCLAYRTLVYVPRRRESVLDVPALQPGEPWVRDRVIQPRVLVGYLRGQTFVPSSSQDKVKRQDVEARAEYDPSGDDPELLARMLTFHDAAGGADYTSLRNDPLARWDLTQLLELDRAVLFGRIELPAMTYRVDGRELTPRRRTTFVRIVLPVKPAAPVS
jgi:hypothetical protein